MKTWVYKATGARASLHHTQDLAQDFLFLARSAYAEVERKQLISNVKHVDIGDVLHFYYVAEDGVEPLGVYEIAEPEGHPFETGFGPVVEHTVLRRVATGPLLHRLQGTPGYKVDWRLKKYSGWPLLRLKQAQRAYNPAWFPGRVSLMRLDRAGA